MRFRWHDDRLDIADQADEMPRLDARLVVACEIAPDPRPEALCLPDIQHQPGVIFPEIHSGRIGQ